jgi:hypothetical protein
MHLGIAGCLRWHGRLAHVWDLETTGETPVPLCGSDPRHQRNRLARSTGSGPRSRGAGARRYAASDVSSGHQQNPVSNFWLL